MSQQSPSSTKSFSNSPLTPIIPQRAGMGIAWRGLRGSARGLALAEAATRHRGPLLIIGRSAAAIQRLEAEVRFYLSDPEFPVMVFPDWECLPYDLFSPHPDIISQRLSTLIRLPRLDHGVVLATAATLLHRLPPPSYIAAHSFTLEAGQRLDVVSLRAQLARASYQNVTQVMEPGEFAVRGGLIDLFPMGSAVPYRIDLFGEEVESIREFDPATQRSGSTHPHVRLLPAREFPLTETAIQQFRQAFRARFEGDPQRVGVYREVSKGLSPPGIEYYLPLFFTETASFFDYLPSSGLCVLDGDVAAAAHAFRHETEERYALLCHDRERPVLAPSELFFDQGWLARSLETHARVAFVEADQSFVQPHAIADEPGAFAAATSAVIDYDSPAPSQLPVDHRAERPYSALFDWLRAYPGRVLIVAEGAGRRETLNTLLTENGFVPIQTGGWREFLTDRTRLALTTAELEKGLVLHDPDISVVTEPQLYGERAAQRRRRLRAGREPEAIIRSLAELRIGDPVVHEDHGVGRYLGLQTLDVGDGPGEFLTLEYDGGDKLYIPVLSLHRISRYIGTDPEHAPLHRLGSDQWEKAKARAREKAYDAAAELLEIHAVRAARTGQAFTPRDAQYQAFADAFPFEETADQERAIEEALADMESAKAMDRLVCGDVGFGKTEVAMRAAFLAVHGGMQVALLVPTTLLAQQHFQNFRDRFAGMAFRIELLSRFRTPTEEKAVVDGLADGSVDIVIGTHRLLQDDIRFRRLGLVIIDEEHRFGVRQKERLKRLRAEVDILTLTATPIPRTLNLALSGLRDMSIIAQPPPGRLSIKTFVVEWNRTLIREACLREIRRGGQVYFLHNEVRTIEKAARQLQELVPEAEIRIGHGQMPERALEHVMLDFYHQRFNVLVCSTIIESGIDIPTANTIIIERADKFGLAQLHQLRGRVGRSHHRAYAYLLIPGWKAITADARKRLEAIRELEDLGAGFTLASHDLEIRGAGELLGEAQSGAIDEVGFALYAELLDRAVRSLRAGRLPGAEPPEPTGTEINLHVPARLPEDYLPDVHQRLMLYKRVAGAASREALQELQEEVIDRFGPLPEPGRLLFRATALRIRATPFGIRKIDAGPKGVRVEFEEKPNIDPSAIIRLLQSAPHTYRLDGPQKLRTLGEMPDAEARIRAVGALLDALTPERQMVSET